MSTNIPYIDEVYNVVTGCSGKGCKANCWARGIVKRFPVIHNPQCSATANHGPVPFEKVVFHPSRLDKPLHWRKPRRVGVCFCGDLFDEQVPFEWVHEIWDIMKACPQHQFFTLTKQPERMAEQVGLVYRKEALGNAMGFWSHVYNGVSITDQDDANRTIPELLRVPGKRWISIEPCLSSIYISKALWEGIDFCVIGCESGPNRRPCPHEWMIDVVEQCKAAGVPTYCKQININGKVVHDIDKFPAALQVRELI